MKQKNLYNLQKNQIIQLTVTSMTAEGSGVGRYKNMAVFVPYTVVGDTVQAKILKVAKTYAFAKIERILTPAKARIEPDCKHFTKCGGCTYRHMTYEAELAVKQQRVQDALTRIGGFTKLQVQPIVGARNPDRYRNKAQLPLGKNENEEMIMGFYANHSHRIINCEDCKLQPEVFTRVMRAFRDWAAESGNDSYDEATQTGLLRHLYLRQAHATKQVMVCIVANGNKLVHEDALVTALKAQVAELESVIVNKNVERTNVILGKKCRTLWGSSTICDTLCGLHFQISPLSFYQVNHAQTEVLYTIAKQYAALSGKELVLDLYCGTGTIGLSMATAAKKVIGVEVIPQAVENAKENARTNHIDNVEFICSDAAEAANILQRQGLCPDVVVLDPPRKGCTPSLMRTVADMQPQRVVYISCNPATLARDLQYFTQAGYVPQRVTPVDMFPRTAHVETVCLLVLRNPVTHINIDVDVEEMVQDKRGLATYGQIKDYVLEQNGLKVSSLYIAQVKQKHGIIERDNYNKPKSEDVRQPQCPPDKERAITEALKHFGMI